MDSKDCRSMKVVFVPHCALNQNARLAGCAEAPATITKLIVGLMDRQIGIIQLPCPELLMLGLDRERIQIRSGLSSHPVRKALAKLARQQVYQIKEYRTCGVKVLGVLGKDGSPSCGVTRTSCPQGPCAGMGAFIEVLQAELDAQGLEVELVGTMDTEPDKALAAVDQWLGAEV